MVESVDSIGQLDFQTDLCLQVVSETIPALLRLKQEGLVRHVGITGLPLKIFPYVLDRCEAEMSETHNDAALVPCGRCAQHSTHSAPFASAHVMPSGATGLGSRETFFLYEP